MFARVAGAERPANRSRQLTIIRSGVLPSGAATASSIDGVEYVTAGATAIVDLTERGYRYMQP
jgi:intracellular sulfur oxidation DsrE/DsrF family protein